MKCSNAEISLISDGGRFFLRKGKIYSMHAVSYWCIINHVGLHFFLDSGEMWLKFVLFLAPSTSSVQPRVEPKISCFGQM